MNISDEAVNAAQDEIGVDLAAGVGNDEDQRKIIRAALEAAAPHLSTALLTRAGTSSHGAYCEPCQDGIHNTTKRRAVDWLTRHNNRWHKENKCTPSEQ